MDLQAQFEAAVADSKTLSVKPDNDTQLQLYALYKQGTQGDALGDGPATTFDVAARFKHSAWAKYRGMAKETAMQQYVELVNKLKEQS